MSEIFKEEKVYILKSRNTDVQIIKKFKGKETIKSVKYLSSILDAALKENRNKAELEI